MGFRFGDEEAGGAAEARIVDQAVDTQTLGRDRVEQAARGGGVGEVFGDDGDGGVGDGQFGGQRLQRRFTARGQDEVPALFCVDAGQRCADAGGRARYQDGAAAFQAATGQDACGAKPASDGGSSASRSAMVIFAKASPAARSAAVRALAT